ncbi:DUF58 domain-containing protein [Enterococcus termitis]|uniref:DUF58 domain-containing protein n=1 Tax=Enterococcus termitis TaxID=332950 RepID=A0A1E5H485_9ENTE|nr:DUF58 domain-containing protein [Enterococcus termitis]OEG19711.1 hypothetical protein BCR25_14785 [Enterococcus termitis]OJG97038.1 hypothetical protein RV18_GL001187 [Enterococcus termitis]
MKRKKIQSLTKIGASMLFFIGVFLYAVVFNNSTGWLLFFFLSFLFLFDLLTLIPSTKKIELRLTESAVYTAFEQSRIVCELFRYRPTLLPIPRLLIVPIGNSSLEQQSFYLYTGQKKEVSFQWTPAQRGFFQELPFVFISSDWLDLFTKQTTINLRGPFIVQPVIQQEISEKLYEQLLIFQPNLALAFGTQTFLIRNFRPYQKGDALHSIDWKQTGKRNELIVKEYEHESESDTHFLFYGIAHEQFEEILSIYYSFTQLAKNKPNFEQVILANIPDDASQEYLLATIEPLLEEPIIPTFSNQKLVLFSPALTPNLKEQLHLLQKNNELFLITFENNELCLFWKDQVINFAKRGDSIEK